MPRSALHVDCGCHGNYAKVLFYSTAL